jgi:cell division protein FtsQ
LQQVGGASDTAQRVPQALPLEHALPLDPNATLHSALKNPPLEDTQRPPLSKTMLPRRRALARHTSVGRKLGLTLFMGLSGALFFSLLTNGGKDTRVVSSLLPALDEVAYWTGLRIEQVALSGQRFTTDSDVFGAIDLPNAGSLLTFNAAEARERIEKLPWVKTVAISRIYPASLEVRITERRPSAIWANDGRDYLVDSSGRVLSALKAGTKVRLPRLRGAGAPEQAQALLEMIVRFPRVAERFEMAERVGDRRWTLHLKDGVVVHLGADREAVALAALSSPDELGKFLTARNVIIDLRVDGRIAVRPATQTQNQQS